MTIDSRANGGGRAMPPWLAGVLLRRGGRILPRFALLRQRLARRPRAWRRRLRRELALTVTGAALLLAMAGANAQEETAAPNNVITVVNGQWAVVANGQCSLSEAIQNANNKTNGRPNTDCAAGNPNGADTINLPANGVFTLTNAVVPDAVAGPIGLPWIASTITINGNGSTIQRGDNAPEFRIMAVGQQGNLTLNNATIRNGYLEVDKRHYYDYDGNAGAGILNQGQLTLSGCTIRDNLARSSLYGSSGGGILNRGTLVITDSLVTANEVIAEYSASGGGVENLGELTITNSAITFNETDSFEGSAIGGGVFSYGSLEIVGSTIGGNRSFGSDFGVGGGVLSTSASSFTIRDSLVSANTAYGRFVARGGGVMASGQLAIIESIFSNNSAYCSSSLEGYYIQGGAVYSWGQAEISNSSFYLNSTSCGYEDEAYDHGGAIHNGGVMTISSSVFSDNSATGHGGAVSNFEHLTIANSTFSRNWAGLQGGAVANYDRLNVVSSTMTDNSNGIFAHCSRWDASESRTYLRQSLVSGNVFSEVVREDGYNCGSFLFADGHNLFGHSNNAGVTGFTPGPTDIVPAGNLASILSPLADNGGPTQTHALPANSPALDRAPNASCTAAPVNGLDQRGQPRNQNGSGGASSNECDIGAFERQGGGPPPAGAFFISPAKAGAVGGVAFAPADILKYDPATGWSMYFDGSDVGLTKNVSAFEIQNDNSILLSLAAGQTVSGAGAVAPHDVLRFVPTSTGLNTGGSFQLWVDGSNVGLTTAAEKIDALGLTADGRIAISTSGAPAVAGPGGSTLKAADEDALGFNRANATWSAFFDGTAVPGLGVEDVNALWVNPTTGDIYISIVGGFNLAGVRGDGKDIVKLTPTGGGYTASLHWDGSAAGLPATIDGLAMMP